MDLSVTFDRLEHEDQAEKENVENQQIEQQSDGEASSESEDIFNQLSNNKVTEKKKRLAKKAK